MQFNTWQYGIFFLIVFAVHWMLPQRARRAFLLAASLYFYASAIPKYLILIVAMTVFSYLMGLWIDRTPRGQLRKALLWLGIAGNLGCLAYFKYSELFLSSIGSLVRQFPLMSELPRTDFVINVILPLGISFFTFEFIHYVVEVYKGMQAMRNPVDFSLFAAFFPTQIAGPIKRFPDFAKQLLHPLSLRDVDVDSGVGLVLRGLIKKTLLADVLAPVVATAFSHAASLGPGAAWFSIFAFAAQIYGDFSGYTDIGRGSAMLLGYAVPENFESPYQSANPAEFWHRWHMSLSTWLRDYLYIPLGGSRVPKWQVYVNLMITMALGGLWHGASWHFMVWGIYQGVLLCAHRFWDRSVGRTLLYKRVVAFPLSQLITRASTLVLVCVGWLLFRADSLGQAAEMLRAAVAVDRPLFYGLALKLTDTPALIMLLVSGIVVGGWLWAISKASIIPAWQTAARRGFLSLPQRMAFWTVARSVIYTAMILLLLLWPPHAVVRFIYFQF